MADKSKKSIDIADIFKSFNTDPPPKKGSVISDVSDELEQVAATVAVVASLLKEFNSTISFKEVVAEIVAFLKNEVVPPFSALGDFIVAERDKSLVGWVNSYKKLISLNVPDDFARQLLLIKISDEKKALDSVLDGARDAMTRTSLENK